MLDGGSCRCAYLTQCKERDILVLGRDFITAGERRLASQLPSMFISDLRFIMTVRPGGLDPLVLYQHVAKGHLGDLNSTKQR